MTAQEVYRAIYLLTKSLTYFKKMLIENISDCTGANIITQMRRGT
jgi:hypothetical protein